MIRIVFQDTSTGLPDEVRRFSLSTAASGALLVLAGLIIIAFPQILAWILAGLMIFAGCTLLGLAWTAWRHRSRGHTREEVWFP